MSLDPLLESGAIIVLHTAMALSSLFLGLLIFRMAKGTDWHKVLGILWMAMMLIVVATSLYIHEIRMWGLFSPIHLLSLVTLVSIIFGWAAARGKKIRAHRYTMISLWIGSLGINLVFTLLPGRILYRVIFGG